MLGNWQEKERRFHLEQALAKAEVRVRGGRASVFDVLLLNTSHDPEAGHVFGGDPVGLLADAGDELADEIERHLGLEADQASLDFLNAILSLLHCTAGDTHSHALEVVRADVHRLFLGKTVAELARLEQSIRGKLAGPGPIDKDYWEGLLADMGLHKRRALAREAHQVLLRRRELQTVGRAAVLDETTWRQQDRTPVVTAEYVGAPTPSPADDGNWDPSPLSAALCAAEAARKVPKDEIPFNTEADDIAPRPAGWREAVPSVEPVKPRYYNRVRTSYDWNKYNQTHYDSENPPPKSVQGYRFNVFYPLLADTAAPPAYRLEPDPSCTGGREGEMKILRFTAGPPYEDLVFRIMGDDWDTSHRQGFKCAFEGGVLKLHLWFKALRYRR